MMNRKSALLTGWLVLMMVLMPLAVLAATGVGTITKVKGTAQVFRAGQAPVTIVQGMTVNEKDQVRTAVDSSVRIELTDGSILNVGEKADMTLDEFAYAADQERKASVKMALGKVLVFTKDLKKLQSNAFQVHTPNAVVGVRGTLFVVWVLSDVMTKVTCFENYVEVFNVHSPEVIVKLGPNDSTDVVGQSPPTQQGVTTPEQRQQMMDGTSQEAGGSEGPTGGPQVDPPTGPNESPASGPMGESAGDSNTGGPILRGPGVREVEDPIGGMAPGNQGPSPAPISDLPEPPLPPAGD